ncbi:MAG: Asp23/Gls24 family envelope stress response protein [Eubacteriales bacterium]|nr:Asp23/Gls24 family envelope stress response protein [Eubacteriales bacterium]
MAKEEINNNNYTVASTDGMKVQISKEVVTIIAGLAATEVKGVTSMAGNITNELVGRLGMKNLAKGVRISVEEDRVTVDLNLNLDYGYSIPKTCQKVQEKVKSSIENMTGLTVESVNIKIANVTMEDEK